MKVKYILYSMGVLLGGAAMVASAGALSSQRETDFYFTFNPTIGLSLSNSKLIIGDLAPGNAAKSNEIVLTINSNNATGYQLLATVGNNTEYKTTSLINGSLAFTSTSGAGVANLTSLADNTWGYTMGTDGKYYGLPLYNATPKVLFSTNTPESITKTFAIGAKAASTQASGEYKNVINFELVGNVSGNPTITLQAGEGGTVSVSPAGQIIAKVGDVIYQGSNSTFTLVDEAGVSRTITATPTPNSNYFFDRWTTTCGATVSGDCTITANFKLGS